MGYPISSQSLDLHPLSEARGSAGSALALTLTYIFLAVLADPVGGYLNPSILWAVYCIPYIRDISISSSSTVNRVTQKAIHGD